MIATLSGEITSIDENSIIVAVGGIGLRVFIKKPLLDHIKQNDLIFLFTHMVVRETELSLYGFETKAELDLFSLLLGVNGIGPRLALSVLSHSSIESIQQAVLRKAPALLGRIPGVGIKTAEKLVIYLHGKIKSTNVLEKLSAFSDVDSEVLAALTALGYSIVEAQSAIQSIPQDSPSTVEERLRLSLQYIAK